MINANDCEIDNILNSIGKTLILFSTEWCNSGTILTTNIESIENEFVDLYKFIKADVTEANNNTERFNIKNVPTVIIIEDHKEAARFVGIKSSDEIKAFLLETLN